jgi:transposase
MSERMSEQEPVAVGIDIAKDTFDVSVEVNGKTKQKQFCNTPSGYVKLSQWLGHLKLGRVHACLEATGQYGEGLAEHLHAEGRTVSVVNPARIKGHAQSQMRRSKTDALDAEVIRHFCHTQRPEAWTPPSPEIKALRALVRRLDDLHDLRTQESNRLHSLGTTETLGDASGTRVVRESITHMLKSLDQQIAELQQHIRDHIDQHPDLARQVALIESIPGLGESTAAKLLAEFVDIASFDDARSLAAWAGVTPTTHRSGTSVRGKSRMSKIGNATVRSALYWPAISAMQHNPVVIAFVEPMRKAHKPTMAIIVAVMRKLLHLVYGVIKNNAPFDPHWRAATP